MLGNGKAAFYQMVRAVQTPSHARRRTVAGQVGRHNCESVRGQQFGGAPDGGVSAMGEESVDDASHAWRAQGVPCKSIVLVAEKEEAGMSRLA